MMTSRKQRPILLVLIALLVDGAAGGAQRDPAARGPVAALAEDVAINRQRTSYDTAPSAWMLDDGSCWAVWKAYHRSKEQVLARRIGPGQPAELGPVIELTDHPAVVDSPQIVAAGRRLWAFWSASEDGRWQVVGRTRAEGNWRPIQLLSDPDTDALRPRALATSDGRVVVCWYGWDGARSRIWLRVADGNGSGGVLRVSDGGHPADRPVLAEHAGRVWAVWDEYVGIDYVVKARQVLPELGPIEQVSPPGLTGRRCLMPAVISSPTQGLCVAWLKATDVVGGDGVIDQLHTLQMAVRRAGRWQLAREENGGSEAAFLVSGLLPDIRGGRGYATGYCGRRRQPLLAEDDGTVWLLWEQKSDHSGRALETAGDLLGRPYRAGRWGPVVRLRRGLLDYRVVRPARAAGGRLFVLGSELPRFWTRTYHRVLVATSEAEPFSPERWDDQYRPVRLPLQPTSPRHRITIDGRPYQLYWADMHCHCGFTPDAEGEPDEILHYGRDRAKLDMMVLQDNDEIYHCFLTESQYRLATLHSQRCTQPGRFLALPGYEWTQRTVKPGVPFNPFMPVYGQRGTFANHRTIIYPLAGGPIVRYPEVGGSFARLCDVVEKAGGILITQHQTFVPVNRSCETNMEVATGWGIYLHRAPEHFRQVLDAGFQLGFVGCSDTHRRNPGLCGGITGIYAQSLQGDAILDSLRKHRCFATNGSKIVVEARANGRLSGEPIEVKGGSVTLQLTAIGTRPIVSATLIRGGQKVRTFEGNGTSTLRVTFRDEGLSKGRHWYYWEIAQEGTSTHYRGNTCVACGHLAWSSPHWVIVR